ncbi:UbiA family prenyltransferase [Pseudohalocynthiibacter aestuariivivens]|jgi:4-hydroxybenzoate polyprenyltransferase/phosphoserine phosphatase|uniref:UbiA family prenyltransferase n=1 Tax=Pseudohalocynthiibacter aestuariivivens TaxID=1591409 RepID=A0ABV5JBQ8_9RHOB|nr:MULTISPECIES: UbiA family prenyltransferase [Pseudohalocynthiibacter]MBS9718694.1 UbiA family prenyltransferase [Pseudohalocynthiibacter aestuariivivens]MCK0104170.1 UbiA family prenyltransferase [Pseudohalocynthiibacter sp. F2068]
MAEVKPLVLDVDGTFLRTDMLYECFWAGLGKHPIKTLKTAMRYFTRPAKLKSALLEIADIRTDLLPVNQEMKALANKSIAVGRDVVLASASDQQLVARLASDHGLSTRVFASDGETNLKGKAKAKALVDAYGEAGFDYAGDNKADRAIWEHAENALVVGHHDAIVAKLSAMGKTVTEYPNRLHITDLFRAIRPHQWVKNILLLLPMIAAHSFRLDNLFMVLLGMVSFSAAASSIYVVNDLLDLEADRLHPTKCRRPFAQGTVPISVGMGMLVVLGVLAIGLGALLGPAFLAVVVVYIILSLAYSLRLKRMRWVDIAALAGLYTLRVVAGAAASKVDASSFMLIFIFPVFITLGCVKRLTELSLTTTDDNLPGRGYGRQDRGDLLNIAGLGMFFALLIFFLYSFSEQARTLYPSQWVLWIALVPIAAWLFRMVRLGYFGKQDYDPIVFAMKDKRGVGLLLLTLSLMFYAAGLFHQWFGI